VRTVAQVWTHLALEVRGSPDAVTQAVRVLRIGGRYLIAGLVTPGSDLALDGNLLTRHCLTVKGIHNYHPDHLAASGEFIRVAIEPSDF